MWNTILKLTSAHRLRITRHNPARTARGNRSRNSPRDQMIIGRMPLKRRMENIPHIAILTTIIRPISQQQAILRECTVKCISDINRQRAIGIELRLGSRRQAREETILDPYLAIVAEAVAVKGGLQGGVVEHGEVAIGDGVGAEEGVDVGDGLVELPADGLGDVAFGTVGGGGLGVVELDVGHDDDLAALGPGEERVVELGEAEVEGAAALQGRVDGGEVLGAAAEPAEVVDAGADDGVEVEVVAPGREGVQVGLLDEGVEWRVGSGGVQDLVVLDLAGDGPRAGVELERVGGIREFPISSVVQELIYVGPACAATLGLVWGDEASGPVACGEGVAESHVASQDWGLLIDGTITNDSIARDTGSRRRRKHRCGGGGVGNQTAN